jgi:hypothetical protein
MTARLLIELCGLSHREAADFLGVRLDTVQSWFRARPSIARDGVIAELRGLISAQRKAADEQVRLIDELVKKPGRPDQLELALSSDDHEAQSKGWPCVGAERRTYAIVAAAIDIPVVLVPRGSTEASAAAADHQERANQNENRRRS